MNSPLGLRGNPSRQHGKRRLGQGAKGNLDLILSVGASPRCSRSESNFLNTKAKMRELVLEDDPARVNQLDHHSRFSLSPYCCDTNPRTETGRPTRRRLKWSAPFQGKSKQVTVWLRMGYPSSP